MSDYVLSNVTEIYTPSANPPILDKVVFTIDHIHTGGKYSTYDVVKFLVKNKIPVTVFMECTDHNYSCRKDKVEAEKIFSLNPDLVTLGIHPLANILPSGLEATNEEQNERRRLISDAIYEITSKRTTILSYHGKGAGPKAGITFEGVEFARGIKSWVAGNKSNPLDTPVVGLANVESAFNYTRSRNELGLSATIFIHTNDLNKYPKQKVVFDTFVRNVIDRRLQALDYYSAMKRDFSSDPQCPLAHFKNNTLSQNLHLNYCDEGEITQVSELQRFLNELGYDAGEVDGIYGNKTKMAVLMYQVANELLSDGEIGDITRSSINAFCD